MIKDDKLLSIIIPTYNMEKYLRKCLDSLCIETTDFNQLEVLVINDGSKDSSSDIAHEYADKYPDVFKVIDKTNGNYGSCINRGLYEAVGKYVKVLDADDFFDKTALGEFLNFLKDHDADLFLTSFYHVYENRDIIKPSSLHFPPKKSLNFSDYYRSNDFKYIQMHAFTYKRENLVNIKYRQTEGISYTDAQWIFLPMSTVTTFYYFPVFLYNYLLGREGQTMDEEVYAKSIDQLMKMTLGRIEMYEKYNLKEHPYEYYFFTKINETLKYIYRYSLVVNEQMLPLLRKFDCDFQNISNSLYNRSYQLQLFDKIPIKLVKYWRTRKCSCIPSYYLVLLKLLYQISSKKK